MNNLITQNIILDACIMSKSSLYQVCERIKPDDFQDNKRKKIFEVILYLQTKNIEPNLPNIYKYFADHNKLAEYQDVFSEIIKSWSGGDLSDAIKSLKDDSARNKLHSLLTKNTQDIVDKDYSLETLCHEMDTQIKSIIQNQNSSIKTFENLATMQPKDLADHSRYFKTGLNNIDTEIHGLFQNNLYLLGARPSKGKSALLQNIILNIAQRYDEHILWFSLEMPKSDLEQRGISQLAEIDSFDIRRGNYYGEQENKAREAMLKLSRLKNINIIDDKWELGEIIANSKSFSLNNKLSLIAVDYLQMVKYNVKGFTRDLIVGEIAKELKRLAKELHVPVIAVSSLKREVDFREDQRPVLADLRESGNLEYDADMILFLYKDVKFLDTDNKFFLEVAKQRNGKLITIELLFVPEFTQFKDF